MNSSIGSNYIPIFLIVLLIILFSSCTSTPLLKNGISEFRTIKIGSIDQTVLIRGENKNNPILLYLHGGPGSTELIPFRLAHKNLEKYFTIVLWEQRGTGKSYSNNISIESMNIDQFISDTHDLTNYLLQYFNKSKLLLVGHSWGTLLGLLTVHKYPDLYYAYVGSGQMVNPNRGEKISFAYVLQKANDTNNKKALKELLSINSQNTYLTIDTENKWFDYIKKQRKWLISLGGEIYNQNNYSLLFNSKTLFSPEYSLLDFIKFGQGSVFSLKSMWPEVMNIELDKTTTNFEIPIFFLQGEHDYNTPTELVKEYFNSINAPEKQLVLFEKSAHHPMYEEPKKFENVLVFQILPYCN